MENYKRVEASAYSIWEIYYIFFLNNFMGNHGELVQKIFLHPYYAGGLHIILLR
jgi:hypothetical protein